MQDTPESPAPRVTVISVSYNSTGIIEDMLTSVPEGVPVVVVDNGSDDVDTLRSLCTRHGARLVRSPRNIGFGPACNLGAQGVATEFLLFLNPDARLTDGALGALLDAAGRHPEASAFNPVLTNADGKVQFKRRSVLLPKSEWLPRDLPEGEIEMPVLSGAAFFVRRAAFEAVGGFDPDLFMYHEDDDLAIRLRQTVGPLYHVPAARVEHAAGRSSVRDAGMAAFKGRLLGESRVLAMHKHGHRHAGRAATLSAIGQLLLPWNLLSGRKRAKQLAFLSGVQSGAALLRARAGRTERPLVPPKWKVLRELRRARDQVMSLPVSLKNRYGTTPYYDHVLAKFIRRHDGARPARDKVAVVVIFPQFGLEASHLEMIRYFDRNGYACLVVSNLPLSAEDRARLLAECWQHIDRPNFGYDFGAYRDAVQHLFPRLDKLERLVLINDSSWFPLPGAEDWLDQVAALDVDYAGAVTHNGIPKIDLAHAQALEWKIDTGHRHFHYASYALSIGPRILRDPAFRRYWQRYKLTEVKNKVVRRGEMGLTRWVIDHGYSHGATYDILSLSEALAACSDAEIDAIAQRPITLAHRESDAFLDETLPRLSAARSPEERTHLEYLIKANASRVGVSYTLPRFIYEKAGFPFLKKSPVWLARRESDVVIDLARDLPGPFGATILEEALRLRRLRGPRHDAELAREAGFEGLQPAGPGPRLNVFGWPRASNFDRKAETRA